MKLKRGLMIALSCVCAFGAVGSAGCGKHNLGEDVDSTKTTIRVSSYDKGFGVDWLYAVKERFEADYADYKNGNKTGVQVIITPTENNGNQLITSNPLTSDTHVFFNEVIDYDAYVAQGLALDLTDYLDDKLPGESKSVLDKLSDMQKDGLARDGKYYMVPHYAGFNGITIDEDFFNSKRLFLDQSGKFTKKSTDSGLSYGPDGKADTYDDGLPATFEEFYSLLKKIKTFATPIVWSGKYQFYATRVLEALAADVNGAANTKVGYDFEGELSNLLVNVEANGSITTETKTITPATGYEVSRQAGYYYSLDFMKTIIDNNYYHKDYCFDSGSHRETQMRFLRSNTKRSSEDPIAMIFEGSWWECEATDDFEELSKYGAYGKQDRNLRFIPFPKATQSRVGDGQTLLETLRSFGFVNANLADNKQMADLAAAFLMYCNTDVSLQEFTEKTSTVKALEYTVSDTSNLTTFCKSLLALKGAEDTTVVYPVSQSKIFSADINGHTLGMRYKTSYGADPSSVFKYDTTGTMTAMKYFNEMKISESTWNSQYGAYLK